MRWRELILIALLTAGTSAALAQSPSGIGRRASEEEIRAWDTAVGPEGKELPPGSGTAAEGAKIYAARCAHCHGATGTEGPYDRLVGGQGTLNSEHPVKTVGSYWPYATTIWDYIKRAMPDDNPGSLTADQVYALTAFLLYRNGITQEKDTLDSKTLPKIRMPNRDGFVPDPRPDWNVPKLHSTRTFESKKYGYVVQYPSDWYLASGTQLDIDNFPPSRIVHGLYTPDDGASIYIVVPSQTAHPGERPRTLDAWILMDSQRLQATDKRTMMLEGGSGPLSIVEIRTQNDVGGPAPQRSIDWYFQIRNQMFRATLVYWEGDPKLDLNLQALNSIVLSLKIIS